ncbi:MAG: DUF58 domain-containing protein, partial [Salinibacterium sp.]|nr:DUF58 domain-containing protein [Salinibacterium sp.]
MGERTGLLADTIITLVRFFRTIGAIFVGWTRRISSVVTVLGWSILCLVPAAFVLGYGLGWVELVAVAFAGTVLIIVATIYLIGRIAFSIELSVTHSRVVVGERATGLITVTNPTTRRLAGLKVEVSVGRGLAEIAMPSLAHGASFQHEFLLPTSRRGVLWIGPVRTVRADPV